jgi:hypothetical protein
MRTRHGFAAALIVVLTSTSWPATRAMRAAPTIGVFSDHGDVGTPSAIGTGKATFDAATRTYTIAGGGENMWSRADHFHYVWTKMSRDLSLTADIAFVATSPASGEPDPHRKACLVIRQTLDADSAYVDAAVHGNGMTSLQWREAKGDLSHDIETNIVGPTRVRVEKRGRYFSMWVGSNEADMKPAGGSTPVELTGEFYVGLGVSAHNTGRIETATFSNVQVRALEPLSTGAPTSVVSTLQTFSLGSKDARVVHVSVGSDPIESPTWLPEATNTLVFNKGGKLYRVRADLPRADLDRAGPRTPEMIDLGPLIGVGHDHVLTKDGKTWAVSDSSQSADGRAGALIFTIPAGGGTPARVTASGPSYVRSFSPDGSRIAYSGVREGNLDVFTIAAAGGAETRLTTSSAKDDGPEFSPDGQWIYFNSDRGGSQQVWRMRADGSAQEQITPDDYANWFPHVAPDGASIVFLSSAKNASDHLDNTDVVLRRMTLADRKIEVLTKLFGGKGSINVSSWSPTGQHLAFVSYAVVGK